MVYFRPEQQLFVSNIEQNATINDVRDFFDDCDGLVGCILGSKDTNFGTCRSWLAFNTSTSVFPPTLFWIDLPTNDRSKIGREMQP
jgi:hypothetical protein